MQTLPITNFPTTNSEKTFYKSLPIKNLVSDKYNRIIDWKRVRKISNKDNFNQALLGNIRVNKRNGIFYIIDGQHRLEALKILGYKEVMCEISTNLNYEEEAYLAVQLNVELKIWTRGNVVNGKIESGDKKWLDIQQTVESCDLLLGIDGGRGKNKIVALREIELIYNQLGIFSLKRICNLLKKTYGGTKESLDGRIFCGMRVFVSKADSLFKDDEFIHKMKQYTPLDVILEARRMSKADNIASVYGRAILYYYNLNRRSKRLPDNLI